MKEDVVVEGICEMKENSVAIVDQHPPSIDLPHRVRLLELADSSRDINLSETENILQICTRPWRDTLYLLLAEVGDLVVALLDAVLLTNELEDFGLGQMLLGIASERNGVSALRGYMHSLELLGVVAFIFVVEIIRQLQNNAVLLLHIAYISNNQALNIISALKKTFFYFLHN